MQVFISYSHSPRDKALAEVLSTALRAAGLAPWRDEEKLPPGQRLDTNLSASTILDLQMDKPDSLRLSLRRAGGGDAHPYTLHQLLVLDGVRDLFRLRQRAPAAAR